MKKRIPACLLSIALLSVAGCGNQQAAAPQKAQVPETEWKNAYLTWLDGLQNNEEYLAADANGFRLVDLNQDSVPELIWDHADFSDHFSFMTYANGSVQEFDSAGRRAVGYELAWDINNTPYYVKEFDTGFTYEFYLCTIENGEQIVLLAVNEGNIDPSEEYVYPFTCRNEKGDEISEDAFKKKFKELTGCEIGNIASDSDYLVADETWLSNILDPEYIVTEEDLRGSLK